MTWFNNILTNTIASHIWRAEFELYEVFCVISVQ